jgi:NAD+ diphosphatase
MVEQNIRIQADQMAIWLIIIGDKLVQLIHQPGYLKSMWQDLSFVHAYQEQIVKIWVMSRLIVTPLN